MKKILILIFVLLCAIASFAQDTISVNTPQSNVFTIIHFKGGVTGDYSVMIPVRDTLENKATPIKGAITVRPQDNTLWYSDGVNWHGVVANNNAFIVDSIYVRFPLGVDTLNGHQVIFIRSPNGLVSGGIVTLDSCMKIDVTPAIYNLNYVQYSTLAVHGLSIAAADPTNNRIDAIIVDTFGVVSVLTGTPAATPIAPQVNPSSQILLTTITVVANAACLSITSTIIYDEGTEWDTTHSGTMTVRFRNTDNPFHLLKSTFISSYDNGSKVTFTKPSGTVTSSSNEILKGFIYLNNPLVNQIQMQLFNGTTSVSNNIVINQFLNVNDTNEYQNLSIPLYAFNIPSGTAFNKLVITFAGDDNSGAGGLYIDYLQLQEGITNTATSLILTTNFSSGAATLINNVLNIPQYSGGSGGISHVVGTNGLSNVNDSTIKLGTNLIENTRISGANLYNLTIDSSVFTVRGTSGTGTDPVTGAGTRMFFYPKNAAFRAGEVAGTQWDVANIGYYSTAAGYNSIASGMLSTSFGNANTSSGTNSFTVGQGNVASGTVSSAAIGHLNTSSGSRSISLGSSNISSGTSSVALGNGNNPSGTSAVAAGEGIFAKGFGEVAVGANNDSSAATSVTTWNAANKAFQIGIGSSNSARQNGFTMLFSGKTTLHKYGVGTFTGTPAYALQVDASGNIIEGAVSGTVTASNGLTKVINDIKLGGSLTAGTSINLAGNGLDISDPGGFLQEITPDLFAIHSSNNNSLSVENANVDDQVAMQHRNGYYLGVNPVGVEVYNSIDSTLPIILGLNRLNTQTNPVRIAAEIQTTTPTYNLVIDNDTIKKYTSVSRGSFSQAVTATTAFTVTIGSTLANNTYNVQVTPTASVSAALFYISAKTTTTFTVTYLAGLTGTVTFDWLITP